MKPKVVVTWPIDDAAVAKLREHAEVVVHEEERTLTPEELREFVSDATAILCLLTNKITPEILDAAGPQLKIVASMSVGFDHIDLEAVASRNVVVTNTPGTSENAVAEHTVTMMLALTKSLVQADAYVRAGKYAGWDPTLFVGSELHGKNIAVVGTGHIGRVVATVAKHGLGMDVLYTDIRPMPDFEQQFAAKYYELDDLLAIADVVTLHVPLLDATRHLMNAARFEKMKRSAFLINTSRGPVVDEAALVTALKEGHIAGAGLDVYEFEPKITPELLTLPNVILTPHTASATSEARIAMANRAADNIIAVLSGATAADAVKLPA